MNINKSLLNFRIYGAHRRLLPNFPFQKEHIEKMQLQKLRKLLVSAYENHEFHRDRFDAAGLSPYAIESIEQLQLLPVLTKDEYRTLTEVALASNPRKYANWSHAATSGSSGTPLQAIRTWEERAYMNAKWLRVLKLNGHKPTDRYFRLSAQADLPERVHLRWWKKVGLCQFHNIPSFIDPEEMCKAYQYIKPTVLGGTKTPFVQLAQYALDNHLALHQPRFYCIGGEVLDAKSREILTRVFGKRGLRQTYGCEELGTIGFQVGDAPGLHISHDTNILELQNSDGETVDDTGSCLLTDLNIYSFPLIRYALGDRLKTRVDDRSGLRVITRIDGRDQECAVWEDGSETNVYAFDNVFIAFSKEIAQVRIVQESHRLCRILVAPSPEYRTSERKRLLANAVAKALKKSIRVDVEYPVVFQESISPDPNGKRRMLISKVSR